MRDQAASDLPWSEALAPICRIVLQASAFPMGIAGLLKFRATLASVQQGDYQAAVESTRASIWAKQTPAQPPAWRR